MKRSITLLTALAVSSATLMLQSGTVAQNTRPDHSAALLSGGDCVSTNSGSLMGGYMEAKEYRVSVGKQLYPSNFHFRAYTNASVLLTCSIDPERFIGLDLDMGIPDGSHAITRMTVDIYQGGNLKHSYKDLSPGQELNVGLDLRGGNGAENIAVEMKCHKGRNYCYLYELSSKLRPHPQIGSIPSSTTASSTEDSETTTSASEKNSQEPSGSSIQDVMGTINDLGSTWRSLRESLGF